MTNDVHIASADFTPVAEAFSHLLDCGNALQLQLTALIEYLGKHVKTSTMAAASPLLLPASTCPPVLVYIGNGI